MFTSRANKLSFRPDLEGLRGVAVLAVMLLHFNVPYIKGGYIGVDVFFVLSGFLISGLIATKLYDGQFDYYDFYNRRIKRLAPASLLVVLVVFVVFSFLMMPHEYVGFVKSIREVLLFKSNVFFAKEVSDYFATEAEAVPLLHTWSLAIEWQFYFLFPVVFVFILKHIRNPVKIIIGLTFAAISFSIFATKANSPVYYSTSARIFEFLVGACAVFIRVNVGRFWENAITYSSLFVLLVLAFVYDEGTIYPGINALYVSFATFLVIVFGRENKLLTTRMFTYLGKISYSAYLWHWPLLVLFYYIGYDENWLTPIQLLIVTLGLSHLTYTFVEQPIRGLKSKFKYSVLWFILIPIALVVSIVYFVKKHDGVPQRLGTIEAASYQRVVENTDSLRNICHNFNGSDIELCGFGEQEKPIGKVLLIGDSHALHLKRFVEILVSDAHLKAYTQTESECLMLPGDYQIKVVKRDSERCTSRTGELYEMMEQHYFDYVVLSERWLGYSADMQSYTESLGNAIQRISNVGSTPVIMMPVAEGGGVNFNRCFYRNIEDLEVCNISKFESNKRLVHIYAMFEKIKELYPQVVFVNPQDVQCTNGVCLTQDDDVLLYDDTHHINDYAAMKFAKEYLNEKGNPFVR